ncbi:MAG: hypothetical protein WBW71_07125, partial [Bacteroidota bacterium]
MSISFSGILEIDPQRRGFVRTLSHGLSLTDRDVHVSAPLIQSFALRPGVFIEGNAEAAGKGSPQAATIERINALSPEEWKTVKEFSSYEVISPNEIIRLEGEKSNISMR